MFRLIQLLVELITSEQDGGTKTRRPRTMVKLSLEGLNDRILPSASVLAQFADASMTMPPSVPQIEAVTPQMASIMHRWGQLVATREREIIGVWGMLGREMIQDVTSGQQLWGRLIGINPNAPNQSHFPAPPHTSAGDGAVNPPAHPMGGALGVVIDNPPPDNNPLAVSGTITNCCPNPIVTIWLTDDDGDNTYAVAATMVAPGPPPQTVFNTTFPTMPPGDYTLTVQVQCGNETVSTSVNVTL